MAFSLLTSNLNVPMKKANRVYFSSSFCKLIETHKTWLKNNKGTSALTISPAEANKFESDFYGLLLQKGIDSKLWFATMRINNIVSPESSTAEITSLVIPNPSDIDGLLQRLKRKNN